MGKWIWKEENPCCNDTFADSGNSSDLKLQALAWNDVASSLPLPHLLSPLLLLLSLPYLLSFSPSTSPSLPLYEKNEKKKLSENTLFHQFYGWNPEGILIHGTKNGRKEKPDKMDRKWTRGKRRERKKTLHRHLCVLSLCPNDIFAHSFEHVPEINISSCRQREWSLDGFRHLFHFPHSLTCRINRK